MTPPTDREAACEARVYTHGKTRPQGWYAAEDPETRAAGEWLADEGVWEAHKGNVGASKWYRPLMIKRKKGLSE